ncbi:MAG: 3-methyl-2-oxobutanoate hydroxymethyltransferase [Actinobacteria bacterium]|uniref:3-methyl-2-oxobutanoate hydroxymethyltransferase n=1 Tax=freshwater metagenome TaxID=449393 RepID=A0A6J7CM29_9ZZZZ|nr:3-methyl-2-oxobutanoate hydroxymethyltransferase [Actinomycetota bacterium]
MSSLPSRPQDAANAADRPAVSFADLNEMARSGEPIVMVTAYDHPSASVAQDAGVDIILVGDSAAMVVLGHDSTLPITMDEMVMLSSAVRRGAHTPLIVGDMPFGSYEASDALAVKNAQRFIKEAGCDAVKLEGGGTSAQRARAIAAAGVPVMGHIGLTPQTAAALGGYKAQGRTAGAAASVLEDAMRLQDAGCFSIVIECVPSAVTEVIVEQLSIPTIGIGAGPSTAGQVLVYHDLLGLREGRTAKFVKPYATLRDSAIRAVTTYASEVRSGEYPGPEHGYSIEPAELNSLRQSLGQTKAPGRVQ